MGAMVRISGGAMDPSGKVPTRTSPWDEPATGVASPIRMVTSFLDANTKKLDRYGTQDGKKAKQVEIT